MGTKQGYKATTKLVSSYAWDTMIKFIQIKKSDYDSNSLEGNYLDTTFVYKDIKGNEQTKNKDESILVPTGQTTSICNIYDVGGNLWEYTTEKYSTAVDYYVNRGGGCSISYKTFPAGHRGNNNGSANSVNGFRIALYL